MSSRIRPPLRRSQGFFGLHFDFHCHRGDRGVGGRTTPAMVRTVLRAVRPDYVQIDCKGHTGFSSYPTRAGIAAPGIVRDQLAVWRRATRAAGVALVMHYSGVWDEEALRRHPAWAAIGADGERDPRATSVFGPYLERLMLPQLVELAVARGVDAAWVDGDCWGVARDWSRWSAAAWRAAHGKRPLPRSPADPGWVDFLDHCRAGFRAYLQRYIDAAHAARPGFEIASNWAYSTHMPEPVAAAVDFISGDFAPCQSVQSARLQARFLMHQGRPWDLMAWGFGSHHDPNHAEKTAVQLCQEAAMVLSLGGGFQIYTVQDRDAAVRTSRLPVLAEVARFCRARQRLCHRAESLPDVAVLASYEDWRLRSGAPFPGGWSGLQEIEGALRLCLDARRHTEVLMDHQLDERLAAQRIVVLPDCHHLAEPVRERLLAWLRRGGRILALGPHALAALGIRGLPIAPVGAIAEGTRHLHDPELAGGAEFAAQHGPWQAWRGGRGGRVLARHRAACGDVAGALPAAIACRVGRGRLVAVALGMGRNHLERGTSLARAQVAAWLRHLDPKPLVEVDGPGRVEVATMRKDGELRINLTSLEGPHEARQVLTWDHIPPLPALTLRIRKPLRRARLEPSGVRLRLRRTRDGVLVGVPAIPVHGAVCVD